MRTLRYKLPLLDEDIDMNSKSFVSVSAVALSALGIAATLGAPQAFADAKAYPGSMCVQHADNGTKRLNWGSVGNYGGDWIFLDCPAVRDAAHIDSAWVRATDRHQAEGVKCGLYSVYHDTAGVYVWSDVQPPTNGGGNDAGVQELRYGPVSANSISHYYFFCAIPRTNTDGLPSEIHTYYVDEKD